MRIGVELQSLSSLTGDVTRAGIFAETAKELSCVLKFPLIVPSAHVELGCQSEYSTMSYSRYLIQYLILLFAFSKMHFICFVSS